MKTYQLKRQIWLPQPRARIFEFFAEPANLERLTPDWLHFEILTPPELPIGEGTRLDYRLRVRGIAIRWQSEIIVWESPRRFVDQQTRGPYLLWIHEHRFVEHHEGTIVDDQIEYAVPGGYLVDRFLVAPDLKRIFQHRHRVLEKLFRSSAQANER